MITEATIKARLEADRRKPCRLATWDEIAYLLDALDRERKAHRRVQALLADCRRRQ